MFLIRKDFSLTINNSFQTSFNKCSIMTAVSYKKKSSKKVSFLYEKASICLDTSSSMILLPLLHSELLL